MLLRSLNHIPFVNIKKLDRLSLIGDAAEKMAAQMERQAEIIRGMYDRQIDKVKDQLSAQIDSLKSQYELGLITREDYNAQAEQYQQTADNEILKINEDMLLELAKINANTYAALTGSQQQQVENTQKATSYASTLSENWGNHTGVIGNIAGTVVGGIADVGVAVWDGITSAASTVSNWVSSWWPFASGTADIPVDMPAMVHQGEGIIPKTFNDAIKSGEYALVGGNNNSENNTSGNNIYVSIQVEGSVVTENKLIDVVYNGLARAIGGGDKEPLPSGV